MTETWKSVPGHGGHYEASSLGRIRVLPRTIIKAHSRTGKPTEHHYAGRELVQSKTALGYMRVTIGVDGRTYSVSVHSMVCSAFHGERKDGMVVCHGNGVRDDNRPENLRWDTPAANNQDKYLHGTMPKGEKHHMAKLTKAQIDEIRSAGLHYIEVMKKYGISRSQAWRITAGKAWNG